MSVNLSALGCTCRGALLIALLAAASPAWAQGGDEATLAAARQLGQEGVAQYQQGQFSQALDKLERAYAVVKVPTLGLWSARAMEKLGKLVEATQRYREVTLLTLEADAPEVLRQAKSDAQKEYESVHKRLPQVTVSLEGAKPGEVTVIIDGKDVPSALVGAAFPVNPGKRRIEGRRGTAVAGGEVQLAEGERRNVTLNFNRPAAPSPVATPSPAAAPSAADASASAAPPAPTPAPPPAPVTAPPAATEPEEPSVDEPGGSSILPWLVVGAGGAVAVTGGVFIVLALDAKSKVENLDDGTWWSELSDDNDNVPTFSTVGFVLTGVGLAGVAAGLAWKLTSSGEDQADLDVQASPGGVMLSGAF